MTNLQQMIIMLAKSNESFEKKRSGKEWQLVLPYKNVEFNFNEDESFRFVYNMNITQ